QRLQVKKDRPAPVTAPSRRTRLSSRAAIAVRPRPAAPLVASPRPRLLAAAPAARRTPKPQRRDPQPPRRAPQPQRRAPDPWAKPPVFVRTPHRPLAPYAIASSDLVVHFTARPYGVKTYVYIDGGKEVGIAPTSAQFDRPGVHHVQFFAPTLG